MKKDEYETKYLRVLDGIRALAIIIIVWFHFWQQSWLRPIIGNFNIEFIPRFGFLLVDMMILLSSFCLFIPYARAMVYKEKVPRTEDFYIKRIARIFPSYFLAMIIAFIFIVILKDNWFNSFFIKDTITHIFFVQNLSADTMIYTNYFVTAWTVALEVQFYLVFPFLAKRFMKNPVLTYIIMMFVGIACIITIQNVVTDRTIGFFVNHVFTFIPVYANGMLAAWFYISYTKKNKRNNVTDVLFTVLSIFTVMVYAFLCNSIGDKNVQYWQIDNRLLISFLFMLFVLSTLLASQIYQKIFNNRVMKFIARISFNLYIYHQFIAVKLKEFRIPYYFGQIPPNIKGDTTWQLGYTALCIVVSAIVAIIMTFLVEIPTSRLIKKKLKCQDN